VHSLRGAYCGGTILNTMVLFDNQVVWSGLTPHDAVAVYRFASRCLTPSVTSTSTASRIRRSEAAALPSCLVSHRERAPQRE
jgi:hypothetical protein